MIQEQINKTGNEADPSVSDQAPDPENSDETKDTDPTSDNSTEEQNE